MQTTIINVGKLFSLIEVADLGKIGGRYATQCIALQKEGVVATNGRQLSYTKYEGENGIKFDREIMKNSGLDRPDFEPLLLIDAAQVRNALKANGFNTKAVKERYIPIEISDDYKEVTLKFPQSSVALEVQDPRYPEWREIVPQFDARSDCFALGVDQLEKLLKAAKHLDSQAIFFSRKIRNDVEGEERDGTPCNDQGWLISHSQASDFITLLMPLDSEADERHLQKVALIGQDKTEAALEAAAEKTADSLQEVEAA